MSTAPVSAPQVARPPARRAMRFEDAAPWAGLAIAAMWIAVLCTSIWGGDIFSSSAGGNTSKVPVAVIVAICALIGTSVVGKRAFGPSSSEVDDLGKALAEERRAREALAAEVAELRAAQPRG